MQDLGTLGGTSSYGYGVNDWGDVVGCSFIPDSENTHAFLWMGGGLFDLNGLIGATSGWVLNEAYGINNSGQIAGMGTFQGQSRAFRLDLDQPQLAGLAASESAVPEPGTIVLLGIGIALMAAGARGVYRKR